MTKTKTGANQWRKRQLSDGIRQDEAEIRRCARLLKLNRRRKTQARLPKVFRDTGLDYLLDLVDDGNAGDEARTAEIIRECPESADYYGAAATASSAEEAANNDLKKFRASAKNKKKKLKKIVEEEEGEADAAEAEEEEKVEATAEKRPDIYGRDAPAVSVREAAVAQTPDSDAEAALRRRMRGLVNRVSERVLGRIASELEAAYRGAARGPANRMLAELVLGVVANAGQLLSDRILVDQAALVAVVGSNVSGSELGAQLAEMLILRLGTDQETLSNGLESSGKTSHNLLLFSMFLCWLGVLSGRLPFDLLQSLADLATEQSLEALTLCLRHAGLQLRRLDGVRMRALLDGLQARADELAARFGEATRGRFLLELLQAVRNNNYRKIPGYDCEYVERTRKAVKLLIRSEASPVEFGVADIRDASVKGRWWVVGAAYAASASAVQASAPSPAASAADPAVPSADPAQARIASMAARLGLKTPQRRAIFAALVGAADADDAAARLLRMPPAATADIASIALKCALRETATYNPFYAAVLLRLRRANRRHAMPLKCAVWDQLSELGQMRPDRAARLADLMADLMLASALPPAAVAARFPFELVPAASGRSAAAACLTAFAGALRRRAADSPDLPTLLTGLAGKDANTGRALAAALVVAGRQLDCPDAEWLLGRLRALSDSV